MRSIARTLITHSLAWSVLICATVNLPAATRTKADNTDNLNLTSSWTTGIVPIGADVAQFEVTITGPLTLSLGADTAWNQINFADPGGDITLSAGNTLTLSNNNPVIFGTGAANLTLDCDVICAGASFSTLRSAPVGQALTYGGSIQGRDVTVTLGNTAGTLRLSSPNSVRIGSIVQVTSSGVKLGLGASTVGNPITSGPLGTNLFTWGSTSAGTELFAYNGAQTLGNPVRIQFSPLNFNSADDLTFTSVVDLNNGSRTLNVASNGILRFTGTVSNGTAIVKTGSGTLELGGTNIANWNNGLAIYGGTVRLLTNDWIPDGSGKGLLRMTNTGHVLDLNGYSDAINGLANNSFGNWAGTVDNTSPGTTSVLTVGDQFTYTLVGNLQNTGLDAKLALVKVGTGGLILSNANTFSGGITNSSASEISLNTVGAAGTGPIVLATNDAELTYNGGGATTWTNAIILEAGARGIISANDGNTLEIASVIGGAGGLLLPNSFSKEGPLTFSGDNTFTGGLVLVGGPLTLNHPRAAGSGSLSIGDPVLYYGSFATLAGGVDLSGANAITNAVVLNRTFIVGGTNAVEFAGPVALGTTQSQPTIHVDTLAGVVISGDIGGPGANINKTGDGLLTLAGVSTFDGRLNISSGPLAIGAGGALPGPAEISVGGSGELDVTAANNFTIGATQTLSGYGTITGDVTVNGTLAPAGFIFTLSFSNDLTLTAGSITAVEISRNTLPAPEQVVCAGVLTFGGNLVVTQFGNPLEAGDTFDLFGFTGNPGSFNSMTLPALDSRLTWNTDNLSVDGNISVVSTGSPQPQLTNPQLLSATNFVLTVTGGTASGEFRVLSQTNIVEPVANWEILSTNTYDGSGNLTITNLINLAEPQRYFRVVQP
jgi:autotransporter-associated beta strand protein